MLWLSKHSRCYLTFTLFLTVRPDPPVSLNWTLLNISPSGLSYDVMVSWESPPSADVAAGWMRLEYEIQYRERNAMNWEAVSLLFFYFALLRSHKFISGHTKKYNLNLHLTKIHHCTSSTILNPLKL